MDIKELEKINAKLAIHNVDVRQNGNETLMLVKNLENLVLIDKTKNNYGEPVAHPPRQIQEGPPRNFVEESNERFEKFVQKGVSGPDQEDEKKESC